ncbi:hypothetical protein WDW86_01310 [Bdellovibrionota bacterium FG-2]
MDFSRRKLPKDALEDMRLCPMKSVKPYALMLAPVYVFLPKNEKFISVKAPLDFFTPEELQRLASYRTFYLPEFVDSALSYRKAGRSIRGLLSWESEAPLGENCQVALPPPPYQLNDSILRMMGPLWGAGAAIEPFFIAVLVNELCGLLSPEVLLKCRDHSISDFEYAVLLSSWSVFLALHLGFSDLDFLRALRERVFKEVSEERSPTTVTNEVDQLVLLARASLPNEKVRTLQGNWFAGRPENVARRILGRIKRLQDQLIPSAATVASVFGERGFIDA